MLKKLSLFLIIGLSLFCLTGCGSSNVEGSLEDIMAKVYADIPESERPMMLMNTEVTEENIEYFLGSNNILYKEALASESGVGSIAHSVVLVRTEENADVEEVKKEIKDKINPRKWICVGVSEENIIVKNKGNLVILILVEDEATRNKLEKGFDNL